MVKKCSYTVAFKKRAIKYAHKFGNRAAGRNFGINESNVRHWRRKRNVLRNIKHRGRIAKKRKVCKNSGKRDRMAKKRKVCKTSEKRDQMAKKRKVCKSSGQRHRKAKKRKTCKSSRKNSGVAKKRRVCKSSRKKGRVARKKKVCKSSRKRSQRAKKRKPCKRSRRGSRQAKGSKFGKVEAKVMAYVKGMWSGGYAVSPEMVQFMARKIAGKSKTFKMTQSWFKRFLKSNDLKVRNISCPPLRSVVESKTSGKKPKRKSAKRSRKSCGKKKLKGISTSSPSYKFVMKNLKSNIIVIFSKKSCPYCVIAKDTFCELGLKYKSVELDSRNDEDEIRTILGKMTGERTVPRVFVNRKCIGGGSETKRMADSNKLQKLVQQ